MTKEKAIASIMKDLDCTKEEAEEVFQMEEKAKKNGADKIYAESEKSRKKSSRERKPDLDKQEILIAVKEKIETLVRDLTIENPEREISFTFKENEYSIVLTKHRPKKS